MAKVFLRNYHREIENLIEKGNTDESIAHCQHILKTFPKYLETYRLLGKAYLDARRYEEAMDIFQRVLISAPDDFVSHIGMSIINDDDGKLDEAIWHMERAFETQPSNAALQGELKRLYGRRDGVEPAKIRMTRGALARMYLHGELYPQAIAEIRSVLSEDLQRLDMQVLLAQAYFRSGQNKEAIEICSALVKEYPYSLDANRILVEIHSSTDQAESTQDYRHRINALDPYLAFATGSVFLSSEVPDAAVSLEHLEWTPGQAGDLHPNWADTLGIKVTPETIYSGVKSEVEPHPDWLESAQEDVDSGSIQYEASTADESIPEWMDSAYWGESTSETGEGSSVITTEPEDTSGEHVQVDIPELSESSTPDVSDLPSEDVREPSEGGELMTSQITPKDEPPDWLKDLVNSAAETSGTASTDGGPEELPAFVGDDETVVEGQDEALAWLERLNTKQDISPEELTPKPEKETEKTPDWMQPVQEFTGESSAIQEKEPLPDTKLGDMSADLTTKTETPVLAEEADRVTTPVEEAETWIDEFPADESLAASETPPRDDSEKPPDWSQVLAIGADGQTGDENEISAWLNNLEKTKPGEEGIQEAPPSSEGTELPSWLSELASPSRVDKSVSHEDELPAWMKEEEGMSSKPPTIQPSDWQPAETTEEPDQTFSSEPLEVEITAPEISEQKEPLFEREPERLVVPTDIDMLLSNARTELKSGVFQSALKKYCVLIKKGRLLNEVINDLQQALESFPVEVSIWQALGDGYMRANRLQDALDAYTKAEELLR